MEEIICYIFSNPLKQKYYDENIIVFPEERFVCIKQPSENLSFKKRIKEIYKFKNYELNQMNLWSLVKVESILLLDIEFSHSVDQQDKTELINLIRKNQAIGELQAYFVEETEIEAVVFVYNKVSYRLNKFGILTFTQGNLELKKYILIPPILIALGIHVRREIS